MQVTVRRLVVRQGVQDGLPSVLYREVELEGGSWRVRVGGGVRVIGRGHFEL